MLFPSAHIVTFERNTVTRMWRASCKCGWRSDENSRQIVQTAAATHDLWCEACPPVVLIENDESM